MPRILAAKQPGEPVRMWSAGCSSGREAYSLAMMFAEAMGMSEFRQRVRIYATDLDEREIEYARLASYSEREMASVPPDLREKYFERQKARFQCTKNLRRAVIFARHDLLQNAPISHMDLVCCRNILMYFNTEGQAKAMTCLHFALNDGGILFLGKAEMLAAYSSLFVPLDLKRRMFAKVPKSGERPRIFMDAWHKTAPLEMINEQARALFGLTAEDVGRPLQDLEVSYRPADLRSLIDRAYAEKRSTGLRDVSWLAPPTGTLLTLEVTALPLLDAEQSPLGATITFADVTPQKQAQKDLQTTIRELETAYEELQSTNEELQTINGEVRQRGEELSEANSFMESILGSFRAGVAVLDQDLLVQVWNSKMEDLWGLRAEEAQGSHFWNLDIGLPVECLQQPLRAILNGQDSEDVLLL